MMPFHMHWTFVAKMDEASPKAEAATCLLGLLGALESTPRLASSVLTGDGFSLEKNVTYVPKYMFGFLGVFVNFYFSLKLSKLFF